ENHAVLFRTQQREGVFIERRCDEYFKEELVQFFSRGKIDRLVGCQYPSESRNSVGGKGFEVGFAHGSCRGHATCIGMLNYHESSLSVKFLYEVDSRVDVDEIIVGKLLAV